MEFKVEKKEKNMAVITVTVPNDEFRKAVKETYNRDKGKFQLPGFRKGHAPQYMIEKIYGEGVFFEGAVNACINKTWPEASKESGLEIVSRPEIDVVEVGGGKDLVYTGTVALRPAVTLGEYKGIEVQKADMEVTEADIDEAIGKEQDKNSRLVTVEDSAAENGDTVKINFDGSMDGVPFEGGKGENYPLVLGTGNFIEGFEEQIVGHKTGDAFEVNVTFPENYHAKDLAGKPAVFKCTVHEIKEKQVPELNDELASDVSEFDTVAEWRESVKADLETKKISDVKAAKQDAVVDAIVENATLEIPAAMLETEQRSMVNEFAQRITSQGLSFDQYMQFTGMTAEKMLEQVKPQAESRIKSRLVLEAVAAAENLEVTEEDFEAEVKTMAEAYALDVAKIKEMMGEDGEKQIRADILIKKALEFVADAAVEK